MKNFLRKWAPAVLLFSLLTGPAWAQNKLATINLKKVFDGYWKTKQASANLEEQKQDIQKEIKNMANDFNQKKQDYQTLLNSADDQNISLSEREKRKKAAEGKLKDLRDLQDSASQYERQASARLTDQTDRMRSNILTEIRTVVSAKAKAAGYTLVIDTASRSGDGMPVFLYSNQQNDMTDAVLAELNSTAPTDLPASTTKPSTNSTDLKKNP